MEKEYYENDKPRDYTKYVNMPKAERDAEIARLEAEAKTEKERILKQNS